MQSIEEAAREMAERCREVIEDALMHWELGDVEREFRNVILQGLMRLGEKHE